MSTPHWTQRRPELVPRGDAHWARRKPELLARGERSAAHLHPECYRGEANARAKLTVADVIAIREAHAHGATQVRLAERYNVTPQSIFYVVHRATWKHVA